MVSNFDFLKKDFPVLSNFGKMAEKYCYSDSNSCLMKLGMIGETIVNLMFTYDRIAFPHDNTAVARIDTLSREGLLTSDLVTILHGLRKVRNKAVHENYASIADDKIFLPMAHSLCEWFMQTYGDWNYSHRDFVMPEENTVSGTVDKEAEEKKESELTKLAEQMAAAAPIIEQTERKKQAYKAANQRPKTEAETRFLIDEQLRMVGWDADTENLRYSKGTRPTKGRNLAIAEYPTNSKVGNRGYADYALFVGEKLVGIIEANGGRPVVISDEQDTFIEERRGYGNKDARPEDYIDAFSSYIQNNINEIAALKIICTKPRELNRDSLKSLMLTLDREGYTTQQLNTAISQLTNEEMAADIISLIRRYAIGSVLISHEARIRKAVDRLRKAHSFTMQEQNWIKRMEDYLLNESVLNITVFDEDSRFKSQGGFTKINKIFSDKLESVVLELNEYLYDDGGRTA